jgi:hypothetical protein
LRITLRAESSSKNVVYRAVIAHQKGDCCGVVAVLITQFLPVLSSVSVSTLAVAGPIAQFGRVPVQTFKLLNKDPLGENVPFTSNEFEITRSGIDENTGDVKYAVYLRVLKEPPHYLNAILHIDKIAHLAAVSVFGPVGLEEPDLPCISCLFKRLVYDAPHITLVIFVRAKDVEELYAGDVLLRLLPQDPKVEAIPIPIGFLGGADFNYYGGTSMEAKKSVSISRTR